MKTRIYPNTSTMTPQEAASALVEYAIADFVGRNSLAKIGEAIREAISSDSRLEIVTTEIRSEGTSAEVEVRVRSLVPLVKILKYDEISQYDGTWSYA